MRKFLVPAVAVMALISFLQYQKQQKAAQVPADLPIFGKINDFSLTDQFGKEVDLKTLQGNVWIANFMFSRCQGPCPMMSQKMARLQDELKNISSLKHVSITMDPDYDKPSVLAEYGEKFKAIPERWSFLTGEKENIIKLAIEAFKLPAGEDPDMHSTRFVLVDRESQIRGYYDSLDPAQLAKLSESVKSLAL